MGRICFSLLILMEDVALCAAHVLSGYGKHGFGDKHREQLIVLAGKKPLTGDQGRETNHVLTIPRSHGGSRQRTSRSRITSPKPRDKIRRYFRLYYSSSFSILLSPPLGPTKTETPEPKQSASSKPNLSRRLGAAISTPVLLPRQRRKD
jgi:hypothetical protein